MTRETYEKARDKALALYEKAHIILTDEEKATLEVADFGLNDLENTGLEIVTYINTDRYCAKEMALFPRQTCPEHSHVPFGDYIGKQETFRVRYGVVYLYVDGEPAVYPSAHAPDGTYTVGHEIVLRAGQRPRERMCAEWCGMRRFLPPYPSCAYPLWESAALCTTLDRHRRL